MHLPNILIIVGTDRNAGKTTLAAEVIANNSRKTAIIGVKISPHFHPLGPEEEIIKQTDTYNIIRENDPEKAKDSSRFLKAGAQEVFYMQVWDEDLMSAFNALLEICRTDRAMVVESGWLRNVVEPGLFVIVNRKGNTAFKDTIPRYRQLPHIWVESMAESFSPSPECFVFTKGRWECRLTDG